MLSLYVYAYVVYEYWTESSKYGNLEVKVEMVGERSSDAYVHSNKESLANYFSSDIIADA